MVRFTRAGLLLFTVLSLTACNQSGPEDQAGKATGKPPDAAAETAF